MSETVWIVLIVTIAVVVLAALLLFKDRLREFGFKVKTGKHGAEVRMKGDAPKETPAVPPGSVRIRGNRQIGRGNRIEVARDGVEVADNTQLGADQEIAARDAPPPKQSR